MQSAATIENNLLDEFHISGIGISSENVISHLIDRLSATNAVSDWRNLLHMNWSSCDDMFYYTDIVLEIFLKAKLNAEILVSDDDREWWDGLPEYITVYRGCDHSRINGLCWSTEWQVAEVFARGHRGIAYKNPVVVEATINKNDAFFATNDRKEKEIVCSVGETSIDEVYFIQDIAAISRVIGAYN